MPELKLKTNLRDPDSFYANLLAMHDGLSKAESDALNARLILILANHIGDEQVLARALHLAAEAAPDQSAH